MKTISLVHCLLPAVCLLAIACPARAQDKQADPADVEAVTALMKKATTALIEQEARAFIECCDPYVECFFADGTSLKGRSQIESTMNQFFAKRPADLAIRLDSRPRSARMLTPDVIAIDWPAWILEGTNSVKVHTMTIVRKLDGQWFITSYLESVPYKGPLGGRNSGN